MRIIDSSFSEFDTSARHARRGAVPPFARTRSSALGALAAPADTLFADRLATRDLWAEPWQARLREFLRRGEFADGSQHIALVDPAGLWAPAVVKTLAAAGAAAVRRLTAPVGPASAHGADVMGLALPRRDGSTLHVCHAATPPPAAHPGNEALALARQSDLTVVIVGPLPPADVDALLAACVHAARQSAWQCPRLLFLVPPGATWIVHKITGLRWPAHLQLEHDDTALNGAAAVWNRVLAAWEAAPSAPALHTAAPAAAFSTTASASLAAPFPPVPAATLQRARDCLLEMLQVEGLLACAVVDAASGAILARESREDHPVDLDLAAASSAQALRAHRESARAMGFADGQLDELTLRAGHRVLLLRMSPAHTELFLLVLLEGRPTDVAGLAQAVAEGAAGA